MNNKLLPIGLIILAIGIGYFYIYPTYTNTIVPTQQQIVTYTQALSAANMFSDNEKSLLTQSQTISSTDLARLIWYMPDSINQMQFLDSLNHLGTTYGVPLSGFTIVNDATGASSAPAPNAQATSATTTGTTVPADTGTSAPAVSPHATGSTNSLTVSVAGVGTYPAFQSLLLAIEQSAPVLDVKQLSIKGSDTGVYSYSMTIRTYWLQ